MISSYFHETNSRWIRNVNMSNKKRDLGERINEYFLLGEKDLMLILKPEVITKKTETYTH